MLVSNQQLISLGRVALGVPINFKFVLKNTGDKPVSIENITAGCGSCTKASTTKALIEPSGTTDINVIFTPNSTGSQIKRVIVTYTGGKIELKFSAEV